MSSGQEIVKSLVDVLKDKAAAWVMRELVARAAFFALPIINPVFAYFARQVIDVLYDKSALSGNWLWIEIQNDMELKSAIKSKNKLEKILLAGHNYADAEKEFDETSIDLIKHKFNRLPRD